MQPQTDREIYLQGLRDDAIERVIEYRYNRSKETQRQTTEALQRYHTEMRSNTLRYQEKELYEPNGGEGLKLLDDIKTETTAHIVLIPPFNDTKIIREPRLLNYAECVEMLNLLNMAYNALGYEKIFPVKKVRKISADWDRVNENDRKRGLA